VVEEGQGLISAQKVVTRAEYYSRRSILRPGNREWVTAIEAICADGSSLPCVIFKGKVYIELSWIAINICSLRFRSGIAHQNLEHLLPFKNFTRWRGWGFHEWEEIWGYRPRDGKRRSRMLGCGYFSDEWFPHSIVLLLCVFLVSSLES
jgi:hypothetical protein